MGNNATKQQYINPKDRPKKNVHWKTAGSLNTRIYLDQKKSFSLNFHFGNVKILVRTIFSIRETSAALC